MTDERSEWPAEHSIAASVASKQNIPDNSAQAPSAASSAGLATATAMPRPVPDRSSIARAENSDLERRLLALERVLQELVAHMAEAEPKFLARLTETFCVPLRMTQLEHDYTDTDSYAAEFVRSVVRAGEKTARKPPEIARGRRLDDSALSSSAGEALPLLALPCIQVRQAGGVWHVTKDSRFLGDFLKEEDALMAIETAAGSARIS